MNIGQIRGALLEEIVLRLLQRVGYRIIRSHEAGVRNGPAGLEVRGRGEWHQIDGLAAFEYTPAFMYPLRILVEAKCYRQNRPVGIDVPRNALGALRDITENYFTMDAGQATELQVQRFNYHSAIFSTSGYTRGAQRFAIAHQIFLIQYDHVPLMQPIAKALIDLSEEHLSDVADQHAAQRIRNAFHQILEGSGRGNDLFSREGVNLIEGRIKPALEAIGGSYYGMLQGQYPMHLLSSKPLPAELFQQSDLLSCRVRTNDRARWYFEPSAQESRRGFRLEFSLPREIAVLVRETGSLRALADVKRAHFSYVDLSGLIGHVRRTVRLELDAAWLERFLSEREP